MYQNATLNRLGTVEVFTLNNYFYTPFPWGVFSIKLAGI